jgi:hypothetical protein
VRGGLRDIKHLEIEGFIDEQLKRSVAKTLSVNISLI